MLHQFLVKPTSVDPRQHELKWKGVVSAMEEQFNPSIRKPIDLQEVLDLCEREAKVAWETSNTLCMLAILNAYLGKSDRALTLCERIEVVGPPALAPIVELERRHKEFARDLKAAINAGKAREFLDAESKQAAKASMI